MSGRRWGDDSYRTWSEDEVERLRQEAAAGTQRKAAAKKLGRSYNEVAGICHRREIRFKRGKKK
jgi:hypothetical protein